MNIFSKLQSKKQYKEHEILLVYKYWKEEENVLCFK